eukprot:tig00020710_g13316.t1
MLNSEPPPVDVDVPSTPYAKFKADFNRKKQFYLDLSVPHVIPRWGACAVLMLLYFIRVKLVGGFYIITYALGIYLLNLFIAFLSPQIDPDTDGPVLPLKKDEEYRPFTRRLPEFKFWYATCKAVLYSFFATFFRVLDIPVFWPILVIYFGALFFVTMKRQIKHMIKYKYIPFSWGKQVYKGKEGGKAGSPAPKPGALRSD